MSLATATKEQAGREGPGWAREEVAARAARDLTPGSYVNLGIGIPQLVSDFLDPADEIFLHAENGILGLGPEPADGEADIDLIDAGKRSVTIRTGAATFDSSFSFCMVRSGRIDVAVLGGMEVTPEGDLANWTAPGRTPGVGGAMDLVQGARQVWVLLQHCSRDGASKLRNALILPVTGRTVVTRVYTDLGVFEPAGSAFRVLELAPGITRNLVDDATEAPLDWGLFE